MYVRSFYLYSWIEISNLNSTNTRIIKMNNFLDVRWTRTNHRSSLIRICNFYNIWNNYNCCEFDYMEMLKNFLEHKVRAFVNQSQSHIYIYKKNAGILYTSSIYKSDTIVNNKLNCLYMYRKCVRTRRCIVIIIIYYIVYDRR